MRNLQCFLAVLCVTYAAASCGAEAAHERTLVVNGTGVAAAAPDVAVVTLGVETLAKTAADAMRQNSEQTARVLAALKSGGVADKYLQTQSLNLQPRYDYRQSRQGGERERVLLGYTATNVVTVRVTDMSRVGQVIDSAIQAGGNRVDGIRFELSDPTRVLADAREAAWQNAHGKAKQLAQLAGAKLGAVQKIESYEHTPGPVRESSRMLAMADASVPVQAGMAQLTVQINVVWNLQ